MIKNIVFDLDGTLANSERLIIDSFQHIYKIFKGHTMEESHIKRTFGETLENVLKEEFNQDYPIVLKEYRRYHNENFESTMKLYPGAVEIIKRLHTHNYTLGIVTSRIRESTDKVLKMYNITKYFKCTITATESEFHKPHPEPLEKCLRELSAQPHETLFVGDTVYDVECARNAGVTPVLVGWSKLASMDSDHRPKYVISNYDDLFSVINDFEK